MEKKLNKKDNFNFYFKVNIVCLQCYNNLINKYMAKINLGKEVYKMLVSHTGSINKVLGVTRTTLEGWKNGTGNPTLKTMQRVLEENGIPSVIKSQYKVGGKLVTSTITLTYDLTE